MVRKRQDGVRRRFKAGQWVEFDGVYSNDWGDDLLLMQGDLFPPHPQMGDTNWTYTGPAIDDWLTSPKLNGHFIGY